MGPTQRNTGPSWGTIAVALLAGLVVLLLLSAASGVDSDPPVCRAFLYYVVPCEGWVAPSRPSVQLRSSASLRGSGSIGADSRRKPMRLGRLVLGLAVISVLAACGTVALPAEDQPAAAPERPVSIDRAVLSEDRLSVRVEFIGGPEFDRDNPCSVAYQGSAEVVGEELEVNVQALPRPRSGRPTHHAERWATSARLPSTSTNRSPDRWSAMQRVGSCLCSHQAGQAGIAHAKWLGPAVSRTSTDLTLSPHARRTPHLVARDSGPVAEG